ncbi:glycosyltransferase family 4 protein [Komagataeibacter europaeus]|uniref:glycosyltransferase family 4 protein n=1 Tax=Komagataeibacter europaeus TaxID=33995 RepID=UPI000309D878|nr:glycosyltransferase family 4 protein [Komagataeibacter europaeus]GBQ41959.1 lipopolysaccharide glycosyl transferase [Komagataeibacter europaeus LMG 18890]
MRIAYVINTFEGGGAALPIPAIADVFRQCGHDVHVAALSRRNGRAMPHLRHAGLDPVVLGADRAPIARQMAGLDAWVRHVRPTHIWTSLTRATLLGQMVGAWRRIPVVSWQHNAFLLPANLALLRMMKERSRIWVGDSAFVTALTRKRLALPYSRVMCWPIFRAWPDVAPAPAWRPGEEIRIGSLGRLHASKGYDVLCRALVQLRDVPGLLPYRVTIGGEGAEHDRLRGFCLRHGLDNVHFAGYVEDTAAFLRQCHLYVQPSLYEGFCIAAHEAMNMGLPVLGSDVGEMGRSIVDGVTGWKLPPRQPGALARRLEATLRLPEQMAGMGQAAREWVMNSFSARAFSRAGTTILQRMAG